MGANMKNGDFSIRRLKLSEHGFDYETWQLIGYLNGERVRKRFKSREEALGEKNRLEVAAANAGEIVARNTRLSAAQLADAEAAFARLGPRLLSAAVEWFVTTYRPPEIATSTETATAAFLAERAQHVRPVVLGDYRRTMGDLKAAFRTKCVHEISTADVQTLLARRKVGKKRFNNLRGELHTFFSYCKSAPRCWTRENPVAAIPVFKITRGLPEILTAQTTAEIMEFVESYTGGDRGFPAGCMAPYFALCLFAGIRPSVMNGEIVKLAKSANLERSVNVELGVIRISPEESKVKAVRQITIQPNLAAWLARYPLQSFPIIPLGARKMLREIRVKFGIGQDVMRHTFISMHVTKFKSLGDTALQAGNSETMIRKHYYNVVSDAEAKAFWEIVPVACSKHGSPNSSSQHPVKQENAAVDMLMSA